MSLIWQNKPPEMPYVHQEYPKWIGPVIVHNADEEAALAKAAKPKATRTTEQQ
jgi:hypothetical protein